jgi:hypothetical protein
MATNHGSHQQSSERRLVPATVWIALLALVVVNCDGHVASQTWAPRFIRVRGWPITAVVYDWPWTRAKERPSRWPPPFRYLDVTDPNPDLLIVQHIDSPQSELPRVGETQIHDVGILVDVLFACMVIAGAYYIAWDRRHYFASRASTDLAMRVAASITAATTVAVFRDDVGKYFNLLSQLSHATVWTATFGFWLMASRGIGRLVYPNRVGSTRSQEEQGTKSPAADAGPPDGKY